MSHIVKGKVEVAYTNIDLLKKALSGVGVVSENERLFRVGAGYTSERYMVVVISPDNKDYRIGFNYENGLWVQYQENYGSHGTWTKGASKKIQDRYIAYHYEKNLVDEGFKVEIREHNDGSLELVAEEASW